MLNTDNTTTASVAIHSDVAGAPTVSHSMIHTRLLRMTASARNANQFRQQLREMVVETTGALSAVHLACDQHGHWNVEDCQIHGEIPRTAAFVDQLITLAQTALTRGSTQIQNAADTDSAQLICTPVSPPGCPNEVFVLMLPPDTSHVQRGLFVTELAGTYQRLWARGSSAVAAQWKLNALAAIVELVTNIEVKDDIDAAAITLANETAQYLECQRVAVAYQTRRGMQLAAISAMADFDPNSEITMAFREAMSECLLRDDLTIWPSDDDESNGPTLAHRELVRRCGFETVVTAPLRMPDGEIIGAWLFADRVDNVRRDRLSTFVRAATPRVASALQTVVRLQQSTAARIAHRTQSAVSKRASTIGLVAIAIITVAMLLPVPYRVRCRCVVEPVSRRFAVAPFDGMIQEGFVEPGDVISKGSLLAKMDGREIQWELSSEQAKHGQAAKRRDIELSAQDIPKALLAQLETERINSQLELLKYRADHLEIRSAIDGVVLGGSLEKAHSAPVKTGQVLFELAPLNELKVEIDVAANEIGQISEGQAVKVWVDGLERHPIVGTIERIRPRSELREDRNVFVAELSFPNPESRFRPGLRGSARITGSRRPLGWTLFHKPWNYLVSRLTWW